MGLRRVLAAALGLFAAVSVGVVVVREVRGSAAAPAGAAREPASGDVLVAYYFHGHRRCLTCNTIEACAREALAEGLPDEWRSGRVVWRTLNYEEEANADMRDRYGLYTSTLILSDVRGGKERAWSELDEVWARVADRRGLAEYVAAEARAMLEAPP